jgi:hypothetical protein
MPDHDHADNDNAAVEHMDAAATLAEREPVRIYGTMPATILATASAILALGAGSPLTALGCATTIVFISAILELVRRRVSPPTINSLDIPAARTSHDRDAPSRGRVVTRRHGPRRAARTRRAPSTS